MMIHECFYRSIMHHVACIAPSGVSVVDGESYGVRQTDPRIRNPSITVTVEDTSDRAVELGSDSAVFGVVYTVTAKSRLQRDAIKDILYSGLRHTPFILYSLFDGYVPVADSLPLRACQLGNYMRVTDIPMFDTDREKLFWTSVVYTEYVVV